MTELSRTLIGRGLVQSLSRSSLRTQGPITPGLKSKKRPLLECRSESPRRMGPCVRRDDLLENSICDSLARKREKERTSSVSSLSRLRGRVARSSERDGWGHARLGQDAQAA